MKKEQTFDITPHIKPTDKQSRGMPIEVEGFDSNMFRLLHWTADKIWEKKAQIHPEGDLPYEGPAFFIATHAKNESTVLLPWLTTTLVNRPIQVVAKDTLLNTDLLERLHVLKRTNKADDTKASLSEKIFSKPARAANSIPIDRGGFNLEVFKKMGEIFNAGHLIGWFLQETRSEEDDLQNPMDGAALVMLDNKDIKTYLVAMSNTKLFGSKGRPARSPSIRISKPFTYRELSEGKPLNRRQVTKILTRKMADLLIQDIPHVRLPDNQIMHKNGDEIVIYTANKQSSVQT